jgi:hypothetical protein
MPENRLQYGPPGEAASSVGDTTQSPVRSLMEHRALDRRIDRHFSHQCATNWMHGQRSMVPQQIPRRPSAICGHQENTRCVPGWKSESLGGMFKEAECNA